MSRTQRVERIYQLLLLAYPAEFRRAYGLEAARDFARLHADAAGAGSLATMRLWLRTALQVVLSGARERLELRAARRARRKPQGRGRGPADSAWDFARAIRLALRSVFRRPAFALMVIVLIALGVGATTTIFSVVNAVLLRPLPYPASERLLILQKNESSFPVPDFVDVQENVGSFDAVGAIWNKTLDLTGDGEPERLIAALMTRDLFSMLGARAWRGRLFTEEEHRPGAPQVAVISPSLWVRRWGGDPSVIGRTIVLSGEPVQVIGVLDPEFVQPEALLWFGRIRRPHAIDTDVFLPLDLTRPEAQRRNMYVLRAIARLGPSVTLGQARAELDALATQLAEAHPVGWRNPETGQSLTIQAEPLEVATVGEIGHALWMFLGAVGLMLVIACANVANLFLARATEREPEMAVRAALGAGRGRIAAQVITEALLLALLGGAAGFVLAWGGVHAFRALQPGGIPRIAEVGVDARILAFAIGLSGLTAVLFGLAPAWSASRAATGAALRETATRATSSRKRGRLRGALVVVELALALVLLAGAGVLFHGFVRLQSVQVGFEPEGVLTVDMDVASTVERGRVAAFFNDLSSRVAARPGVRAIGASWRLPFADGRGTCCWRAGLENEAGDSVTAAIHPVAGAYFDALGIESLEGRDFGSTDQGIQSLPAPADEGGSGPPVIPTVVNRIVAERLWPGRSAIGRSLQRSGETGEMRVIGVVEPILHWRLEREAGPEVYVPYAAVAQWRLGLFDIAIRHDGPAAPVAAAVRAALRELEPELPIIRIMPMEDRISGSIATPRFYATLLATFAVLALVLAAAGVYGSMLYVVGLRRREMGIRLALGADSGDVVRLMLGRGVALIVVGMLFGLAGALASTRVLRSLVFDVSVTDPLALITAATVLAGSGLLACWLPARRAGRADPTASLRTD